MRCKLKSKGRNFDWRVCGGLYHSGNSRKTGRNQTKPRTQPTPTRSGFTPLPLLWLFWKTKKTSFLFPHCFLSYFLSSLIQRQSWISPGALPVLGMRQERGEVPGPNLAEKSPGDSGKEQWDMQPCLDSWPPARSFLLLWSPWLLK